MGLELPVHNQPGFGGSGRKGLGLQRTFWRTQAAQHVFPPKPILEGHGERFDEVARVLRAIFRSFSPYHAKPSANSTP